jgi:hypothetical protein
LKFIDETAIKRIDQCIWGPDDLTKPATLFSTKIRDNGSLLVEVKDDSEVDEDK